jgi:predicted metalloenzyme YecM
MREKFINKVIINMVKNYLENNNIETILNSIPDETICKYFDKAKNSFIEMRHLKEEVSSLRKENEELKNKLIVTEKKKY